MTDEEQVSAGITKDHLRLSVGLEHLDDIKADMFHAFSEVAKSLEI